MIKTLQVLLACFICLNICQAQKDVQLDIRIVRQDKSRNKIEEGVPNEQVQVVLSRGAVPIKRTDANGAIRFVFPANPCIKVTVGGLMNGTQLHPMSGMVNQSITLFYGQVYTAWSQKGYQNIIEYANGIHESKDGNKMPDSVLKELNTLKKELNESKSTDENTDVWRENAISAVDQALRPIGKLGVTYKSRLNGAFIVNVVAGKAASNAGIMPGDIIVSVDGFPIDTKNLLPFALASAQEETININLMRNGKILSIDNLKLDY